MRFRLRLDGRSNEISDEVKQMLIQAVKGRTGTVVLGGNPNGSVDLELDDDLQLDGIDA